MDYKKEALEDFYELINNLEDDLQMDLDKGEDGYACYKDSHVATKAYTLKVLKQKIKKWEKFASDKK